MAQGKSQDRRMVRNRRVMIYTFLIILTLFYISAHRKLERERAVEAAKVTEAVGAGTVFLWGLRSGAHGPGYSGDPRPLRGAGIFVCLFGGGLLPGLRSGWAGTGPVPFRPSRLSLGAYPVSGGDPEHGGFRKPVSTGNGGRERAASLRAALLGASGPLGTGAVPVCCAGISGRARAAVCLSPVCAVIGINM